MQKTAHFGVKRRLTAAIGTFALLGAMGAGHAETTADDGTAHLASSAKNNADDAVGEAAGFDTAFAPFDTPAEPILRGHAVDITEIVPAVESNVRDLGAGVASFYGKRFNGRLTANGERFNMHEMTAAHKTLPFGSRVRVTNPRNGESVVVRINDRGPFVRGRHIDLSRAAAAEIGMISRGHATVEMELLES